MICNEYVKGEEDELGLLLIQDLTVLIYGFYNPLSGILSFTDTEIPRY